MSFTSHQCPCLNISVTISSIANSIDSPFNHVDIKSVVIADVCIHYPFLSTTVINDQWTVVKCTHCKTDVCATFRDDPHIVILFVINNTECINDMIFSPTYGIYLKHATEYGFVGDDERSQITKIRKEKVDKLYEQKEKKIQEFVKRIEEQYEMEKNSIENEERDMLAAFCNEDVIDNQLHEDDSYFTLEMEEDINLHNELRQDQPKSIGFLEMMTRRNPKITAHAVPIAKSLTSTLVTENNIEVIDKDHFPNTFQEYVCHELNNKTFIITKTLHTDTNKLDYETTKGRCSEIGVSCEEQKLQKHVSLIMINCVCDSLVRIG